MKTNIRHIDKGIASIAVCALGAFCMYITDSPTGFGWDIFCVFWIWL